jgi:hypothetical protein
MGDDKETTGTAMANFAAQLFTAAVHAGASVVAENPAPSRRYTSAWELPAWQKVLGRPDVCVVPYETCAHQPPDAKERHRNRTWLATNKPQLRVLSRACDGTHAHTRLAGGGRCKNAGAYGPEFCTTAATAWMPCCPSHPPWFGGSKAEPKCGAAEAHRHVGAEGGDQTGPREAAEEYCAQLEKNFSHEAVRATVHSGTRLVQKAGGG